jgi:hypothetical protein
MYLSNEERLDRLVAQNKELKKRLIILTHRMIAHCGHTSPFTKEIDRLDMYDCQQLDTLHNSIKEHLKGIDRRIKSSKPS